MTANDLRDVYKQIRAKNDFKNCAGTVWTSPQMRSLLRALYKLELEVRGGLSED